MDERAQDEEPTASPPGCGSDSFAGSPEQTPVTREAGMGWGPSMAPATREAPLLPRAAGGGAGAVAALAVLPAHAAGVPDEAELSAEPISIEDPVSVEVAPGPEGADRDVGAVFSMEAIPPPDPAPAEVMLAAGDSDPAADPAIPAVDPASAEIIPPPVESADPWAGGDDDTANVAPSRR